jgi:RimJ/RimL family protein N-acetyltransferase
VSQAAGSNAGFSDLELSGARLLLRTRRADGDAAVATALAGMADGTGPGCALVERSSGRAVGAAALRIGPPGDGEIGYWVAPDSRGAGYAAEATGLLADWGFDLGLERIRLLTDVHNLASVRTALRAGFAFEGLARGALLSGEHAPGGPRRGTAARFAALPTDRRAPIRPSFPWPASPYPTDGVVLLRPAGPDDTAALVEAEDAVAAGFGFTGEPPDPAAYADRMARSGLDWLVGAIARFALVDVSTGATAGSIDLRRSGPPQVGGVGYTVHPAFRGRGYTARALRLLSAWAFGVADFARLELGAKADNVASQRAAASGGFQPDGVRQRRLRNPDGTFSDEVRFALLNPRLR